MSFNLILLLCFLACSKPIYSAYAPFITKCILSDSSCLKSSAQAALPIFADGIPDLGIDKLDPFFMKSIVSNSPAFKLKLNDITATGLKQCIIKHIQFNDDFSKLTVKLLCTVDAKGKYNVDGTLLSLKISGDGDVHVVLRKALIFVEADVSDVIGEDGMPHLSVGKWRHSYELKDKATVELDNLFSGNELLARTAKDLISTNPNDIIVEAAPEIIKAVCAKIIKSVNKFFGKLPKSELVL